MLQVKVNLVAPVNMKCGLQDPPQIDQDKRLWKGPKPQQKGKGTPVSPETLPFCLLHWVAWIS